MYINYQCKETLWLLSITAWNLFVCFCLLVIKTCLLFLPVLISLLLCSRQPRPCWRRWTRRQTLARTSSSLPAGCGTGSTWSPRTAPPSILLKSWLTNCRKSLEVRSSFPFLSFILYSLSSSSSSHLSASLFCFIFLALFSVLFFILSWFMCRLIRFLMSCVISLTCYCIIHPSFPYAMLSLLLSLSLFFSLSLSLSLSLSFSLSLSLSLSLISLFLSRLSVKHELSLSN